MSHGGKKPYIDRQIDEKSFLRTFSIDCDSSELHWHRDNCSRQVEVISGKDWKFQYDNELPFELNEGDTINIKKLEYHRIIKGDTNLKIRLLKKF